MVQAMITYDLVAPGPQEPSLHKRLVMLRPPGTGRCGCMGCGTVPASKRHGLLTGGEMRGGGSH